MAFYGQATLNGNPVAKGFSIRAYYGSELAGEVRVQDNGIYGYTELNRQRLLVKNGSGAITFKFIDLSGSESGGNSVISYPSFSSGIVMEKNLAFTTLSQNQSSGGGGGGGGAPGPVVPTDQITQTTNGDTNEDGKVDIMDFNRLMIDWGKSGSLADFNQDGKVDIFDFNSLMVNWSK